MPSRHSAAAFESTKYSRDYTNPGVGGPKVAFAPKPIDQLDGHLVMAHGTNIIKRDAHADMYLSMCVHARRGKTHQCNYYFHEAGPWVCRPHID